MKIGIIGSGFGIYGYLPAVCNNSLTPIILEKNRDKIEERPELSKYNKRIIYVLNEKKLFENSSSLIIATTPKYQTELLQSTFFGDIQHFYLEKPISPNLRESFNLIQFLKFKKFNFSVAYLFLYTSWYVDLKNLLVNKESIYLNFIWKVKKTESNWKSDMRQGGGLLYFYGIHFLASLYDLGILEENVDLIETDDKVIINARDLKNNKLMFEIEYADKPHFSFKILEEKVHQIVYENETPFGLKNRIGTEDTRVGLIEKYLRVNNLTLSQKHLDTEIYIYNVMTLHQKI
jgi:hypothetical protein